MTALIALAAVLGQDAPASLGQQTLADIDGKKVVVPASDSKATVLLFVAVDCPISNRYAPEMQRIYKDFHEKSVTFVRVYVDDSVGTEEIRKHGVEFKMPSAAILDARHDLVKKLGMTVTPEVAVVTPDGKLQYRGRINDLYIEHGRLREGQVRQDLRVAIEEVLAGKAVSKPFTNAIGCGIPDGD